MYERILVPYDGSSTSESGLQEATRLAKLCGARIRVVHLIDDLTFATGFESGAIYASDVLPAMRKIGTETLDRARAKVAAAGVDVDTQLIENTGPRIAERVVELAQGWRADLIVIGTHGRRGTARLFMGSDAEQILRIAPVPVLLVRDSGRVEAGAATRA